MDGHYAEVTGGLSVFGSIGDTLCGCKWNASLPSYQKFIRSGKVTLSLTIANALRYIWEWIAAIFAFDSGTKCMNLFKCGWMKLDFVGEVSVSEILLSHTFHAIPFLKGSNELPLGFIDKENERLNQFFEKLTRQIFIEDGAHDPAHVLWEQNKNSWKEIFKDLRFNLEKRNLSISVKKTVISGKMCNLEAKLFLGDMDPSVYNGYVLPLEQRFLWPKERELTINETISGIACGVFENIQTERIHTT